MRKYLLAGCMMIGMCFLAGCGNEGTKERIRTGEEIAVEQREKAEEAVEQSNSAVENFQQQADEIEEE